MQSSGTTVAASWSFDQLLWSPRTLAMAAVTLFPAVIALIYRITTAVGLEPPITGFAFFSVVTATVSFPFVAPMLALFYSSGIIIDEMENGTIPFLITRPVERRRLAGNRVPLSNLGARFRRSRPGNRCLQRPLRSFGHGASPAGPRRTHLRVRLAGCRHLRTGTRPPAHGGALSAISSSS